MGGINTYTSIPFAPPSFGSLEHPPFLHVYAKRRIPSVAVLGHAVVLLFGAIVPQALAVVPQVLTVVPLPGSGSTVASGQAQLLERL